MAAAAAEEHERHEPSADHERKERSERKCDPAVLPHRRASARIPGRYRPNDGKDQNGKQSDHEDGLAEL